ncbi:MAG: phosphate ABC transporter permease subunit PstC [Firmicutes bacterium]|nr:phosphate ABC transporter permease subunit PstC [Bacillota bacterium]
MKISRLFGRVFYGTTGFAASSPLLLLLLIGGVLLYDAWPAWEYQGWSFFTGISWNMGNMYASGAVTHHGVQAAPGASFGILPFIVGTLGSSLIALVIAVPIAVLTAFGLVYKVPVRASAILSPVIELLAGIPSVVYGLWGLAVLAPFVQNGLGPLLAHLGRIIPYLAGPVGTGLGMLTSGLVLAVMITPVMIAATRDLLMQVPRLPVEGALALGLTSAESVRYVSLPYVRRGVFGAIILAWGRALGETMAVLMISGNANNYLPPNLYSPISTMASTIAALLDSALTDFTGMAVHALALIAFTLLLIAIITNLLARVLLQFGHSEASVEV